MANVVNSHVFQPGAFADALPRPLEVGEMRARPPAGDDPKIAVGARQPGQHRARLWRSLKYEAIYLHEIADGLTARRLIRDWVRFYNLERPHAALDGRTPAEAYRGEPPVDMMDKSLRALPTSPQAQQQQQEDRSKGILAA